MTIDLICLCFVNRDVINFVSNIWHGEGSKAEGWPAKIRVIAPKYVKYVENQNSFDSNYTVQSVKTDKVSLFKMLLGEIILSKCLSILLGYYEWWG